MQTTERIRPVAWAGESARNLPVVLISLFIVVAGVDALLVSQPELVHSLRDDWQSWVEGGVTAPWATLVAATAAVACAAIAAAVLTVAVRGIVDAPYLWLASALVAGCCFAISRMTLEVPVRLPTPLFACVSAIMLLGGGAFFQGRSLFLNMTGAFLAAMPLALLGVGYARGRTSTGAPYVIDEQAQLLFAILTIASVGTLLIAIASRRLRSLGGAAALGTPSPEQIADLLERAQAGEQRAAQAEYRLQYMVRHASGAPRLDDAYETALQRGSGFGSLMMWVLLVFVGGGAAIGFFGGYLPLQQQLESQQKLNHELTQQHAAAVAKLRAEFEQEHDSAAKPAGGAQPAAATPEATPAKPGAAAKADGPKVIVTPDPHAKSAAVAPAAKLGAAVEKPASKAPAAPAAAAKPAVVPAAKAGPAPDAHPKPAKVAPSEAPVKPAAKADAPPAPEAPAKPAAKAAPAAAEAAPADAQKAPKKFDEPKSVDQLLDDAIGAPSSKRAAPSAKPAPAAPARRGVGKSDDPLEGLDGI